MNNFELILLGLWKSIWLWLPPLVLLIGAGVYEWKKGIKL